MKPGWRPTPLVLGSAGVHAAALVALALAPGQWPWIAGAVFANHVGLATASMTPRSRLLGPNLSRLPAEAAARGEVALTLDDGPDPEVTPRVLDLLDRHGARATFFCIGRRAAACPEIVAETVRRGHRVENHTWSHPNSFACYPPGAMRREMLRAQEVLERTAGTAPRWFRAPAGMRNLFLDPLLHTAGLALVSWTRRGFDTVSREPALVARRLLRGLAAGDVLLLHDGSALRGGGNPPVLEVLPRVLDALAERGLRAVPFEGPSPL
ncbi:MAG TPA: polysaccharide deacetylase family protein [Thermoanaerobaculia bacterium]|nr:polysaccharide deacetylase family protein [Thermoanaerobaculia bacterium]